MIDVNGIRDVLKESSIYIKENSKNFICSCPYCGDHRVKSKKGHFYVSKDDNIPVCHCWLCLASPTIKKLLVDLTGSERKDLIVPVNNKNYVKKSKSKKIEYKIPDLEDLSFSNKSLYMKRRTFGRLDITKIPNLIFDIKKFFELNRLDISKFLTSWEQEYLQNTMVGFLSKRNTILYCRAISNNVKTKFKKIVLQEDSVYPGLDYYCIDNYNQNSNLIVLSEGNFDILGCYSLDTLDLKSKCRAYCAGCTFSYEQLLKSASVDFSLYRPDVLILSDADKQKCHYKKFIENVRDITNSIEIYYNSCGKDFGDFPHKAVKLF